VPGPDELATRNLELRGRAMQRRPGARPLAGRVAPTRLFGPVAAAAGAGDEGGPTGRRYDAACLVRRSRPLAGRAAAPATPPPRSTRTGGGSGRGRCAVAAPRWRLPRGRARSPPADPRARPGRARG